MWSYICLVWNQHDPRARDVGRASSARLARATAGWAALVHKPGFALFAPPQGPRRPPYHVLRGGRGALIGTLFHSSTGADVTSSGPSWLTLHEEATLLESEGRSLITTHWGSYVLFLSDPIGDRVRVLRGPMSSLPCFRTEQPGVTIFFSRADDAADTGMLKAKINWDHIRAQSVMGDYLCTETGLKHVSAVIPGECIFLDSGTSSARCYWSPRSLQPGTPVSDLGSAAGLLRTATQSAIDSWSASHESILVSLSGGFDSSVVLGCAAKAAHGPRVMGVNFYSRESGDERVYARSMSEKSGARVLEVERNRDIDLRVFLDCARTASPVLHFTAFETEPMLVGLAEKLGATVVFDGELGDDVFGHAFAPEILADSVMRYRFRARMLRALLNYAVLNRVSLWHAARTAIGELRMHRRLEFASVYRRQQLMETWKDETLATDDSIALYEEMLPRFIHPWLRDFRSASPAWFQLIYSSIAICSTWAHSAFSDARGTLLISPLASQPLIEASLAIPSDLHLSGAESAAVARHAFAPQLSPAVLQRGTAKGTPDLWLRDIIARQRPFLREVLLDGLLIKEGILDKSRMEAALSGEVNRSKAHASALIVQLYIECWLRRWAGACTSPEYLAEPGGFPGSVAGAA